VCRVCAVCVCRVRACACVRVCVGGNGRVSMPCVLEWAHCTHAVHSVLADTGRHSPPPSSLNTARPKHPHTANTHHTQHTHTHTHTHTHRPPSCLRGWSCSARSSRCGQQPTPKTAPGSHRLRGVCARVVMACLACVGCARVCAAATPAHAHAAAIRPGAAVVLAAANASLLRGAPAAPAAHTHTHTHTRAHTPVSVSCSRMTLSTRMIA
jgi:hypothetical protein